VKVEFRKRFFKDFENLPKQVQSLILPGLEQLGSIKSLEEIYSIKKLRGYKNFYRLRIGDYRIGCQLIDGTLIVERVLHRKDIYRYYP